MGPFIFDPTVGSTACPAALTAPIYLVRKQTHRYDTDASSASCNSCVGNTSIGFRKPVRLLGKRILPELRTEPISQQRQRHFEFHQQGVFSVLRKADRVRWPRRSCVCLAQLPWFPGLNMVPENGSVVVHTFDVAWSAFACVGGAGRRRQEHLVFLSHRRWRRRQMRPLAFVQPDDGG
jgi:hypothetical protein